MFVQKLFVFDLFTIKITGSLSLSVYKKAPFSNETQINFVIIKQFEKTDIKSSILRHIDCLATE